MRVGVVFKTSEITPIQQKSNWLCWLVSSRTYAEAENNAPQDCGVEGEWVGTWCSRGVWNVQGNSKYSLRLRVPLACE